MGYLGVVVESVASCVCNCRTTPVAEQRKYLDNSTKNIETLRNKKAGLVTRMDDVKIKLQMAEEQGKTHTSEAQNWLNRANDFIVEVDGLEEKAKEARRFLYGVIPNCTSRLNLGQHISKLIVEVNDILEKGDQFSDESLAFLVLKDSELPTTTLMGKTTAQENMEMLALKDSELPTKTLVGKATAQKNMEMLASKESKLPTTTLVGKTTAQENMEMLAPKDPELPTTTLVGKTTAQKNMEMLAPKDSELPTTTLVGKTTALENMEMLAPKDSELPTTLVGKTTALENMEMLAPKDSELPTTTLVGKTSAQENVEMLAPKDSELPTTTMVGKTTAQKNLEMVWECLMDDETRTIGVHGMGGVGKTTIMKEVSKRLLEQQHRFDKVILVTVSKGASARKLQDDIAKALGLTLSNEGDETERSGLLLKELEQRKRLTLILDDVWQVFSLHEIGIPDFTNDSGCKLVLTSRSKEVCQRMGCRKYIQIELLSEDEAWELFLKIVGVKFAAEVEKIAKAVLEECSRLPLAIITVGGAMRGKNIIHQWRAALTDQQEVTSSILKMEEQVIERLKFSYKHLRDNTVKNGFLDCALYPEDGRIYPEGLIEHWVVEGLINGNIIESEVSRGQDILDTLKHSCMLEDGSDLAWEYVKMHDLTRDMALRIIKEMNPRIMVKAGVALEEFPNEEAWGEDLERASFIGSGIKEILISPNCPGLTTLLLNSVPSLKHIAHGFFVQMPGLKVLNLSFTGIELLPNSISDLLNLQVLDVSWCRSLMTVPSLEKLQSLRVLRLGYTMIEELPHGMEVLVDLTCLHLEGTRLREIRALLISKFSLLQELCMDHIPACTSVGLIDEVLSLTHLESLSLSFESLHDFCYYQLESQQFKHLDYFFFVVGHAVDQTWKNYWKRGRSVLIHADVSNFLLENALLLPQNTEYLEFMEFEDLTRFPELVHFYKGVPTRDTLHCLKKLRIWFCENLEYLLSFQWLKQLQNLVEVDISDCWELEELIVASEEEMTVEGTRAASTSIKKIRLCSLPKLKTLFSKRMLHYFQNLEEVRIERCRGMEELIAEEVQVRGEGSSKNSNNNTTILLPRLKILDLEKLPKLKSIWRGEIVCDSLQTIKVKRCVELKSLPQFGREDRFPPSTLQDIRGSKKWWDSLEWDDPFVKNLLQPLFHEQYEDEDEVIIYDFRNDTDDED